MPQRMLWVLLAVAGMQSSLGRKVPRIQALDDGVGRAPPPPAASSSLLQLHTAEERSSDGELGLSEVLHKLDVARASAALINEDNKRLRDQLASWHEAGAQFAMREKHTLSLLQEEMSADEQDGMLESPLLPSAGGGVASPSRRRRRTVTNTDPSLVDKDLSLTNNDPSLIKVDRASIFKDFDVHSEVVAMASRAHLSLWQAQALLVASLAMLVVMVCLSTSMGGERPKIHRSVSTRFKAGVEDQASWSSWPCLGICFRHWLPPEEIPTNVEIGEIHLGGLSTSLSRGQMRVLVQPGGGATTLRTRFGVPVDGDESVVYFTEVMHISTDVLESTCELMVYFCDGLRNERVASIGMPVRDLLRLARRRTPTIRLDLIREGHRWESNDPSESRIRPYLAMRLREVEACSQSLRRRGNQMDVGHLHRQVSGHLPY